MATFQRAPGYTNPVDVRVEGVRRVLDNTHPQVSTSNPTEIQKLRTDARLQEVGVDATPATPLPVVKTPASSDTLTKTSDGHDAVLLRLTGTADVPGLDTALSAKQTASEKGQPSGYAGLGSDGKVPLSQSQAVGGNYSTFTPPALTAGVSAKLQNTTGRTILMTIMAGVISAPGQNGHMYFEVAAGTAGDSNAPADASFKRVDFVACRNNQASGTGSGAVQSGGPNLGSGNGMKAVIRNGDWYRVTTETQAGYLAPTYAYVSGNYVAL